jgi:GT2 family glycosyltransferase
VDASIVVLATRDPRLLSACLAAIERAAGAAAFEVVVVLGAATDAVREVARAAAGVRVVDVGANTGTAAAWNLGFDAASAPRVAVLHEDTEVAPGWLDRLLATMEEEPRAGVVAARNVDAGGALLHAGAVIWRDGSLSSVTVDVPAAPFGVGVAGSACMLVDRAAWEAAGGFDERFFPFTYVDVDFALALRARGLRELVDPRAEVVHHTGASQAEGGGALGTIRFRHWIYARQLARLRAKWGPVLERLVAREDGDVARALAAADALEPLADPPRAERPLTGAAVDLAEVRERLRAAEHEVVRAFADELAAELEERDRMIAERDRWIARLEAEAPALRERSDAYGRIVAGRWWRLRDALLRLTPRR